MRVRADLGVVLIGVLVGGGVSSVALLCEIVHRECGVWVRRNSAFPGLGVNEAMSGVLRG